MPKNYAAGGRALPGGPPGGSGLPPANSWGERCGALKNLPPFLKLIWKTSPWLTAGNLTLRLFRAVLPVATLYVGKLIIDEVIRLASSPAVPTDLSAWISSGMLDRLGTLFLIELGLAILADVLGRVVSLLDSLLSERFTNETSVRLAFSCWPTASWKPRGRTRSCSHSQAATPSCSSSRPQATGDEENQEFRIQKVPSPLSEF